MGNYFSDFSSASEIFIRVKQATKRDMPIKPSAYCLATYQWYSIQTKIKQKRNAKGETCNTGPQTLWFAPKPCCL